MESTKMANVVVSLSHPNLKAGVTGDVELVTRHRLHPIVSSSEFVLAAASRAFHDFRCAGVESQGGRQHHADRFFRAIRKRDAMAHAFAVKVNAGSGGNGDVVEMWGNC